MPSRNEERLQIVVGEDIKRGLEIVCESSNQTVSQVSRDLLTSQTSLTDRLTMARENQEERAKQNLEALEQQKARLNADGYEHQYLETLDGLIA